MDLVQKQFSYAEYYEEEQREFGHRQKQKRKMTRLAHNAEMAENKAMKAKRQAIKLADAGDMEAAKLKAAELGRQLKRSSSGMEEVIRRADKLAAPKQERLLKRYSPDKVGSTRRGIEFGPIKPDNKPAGKVLFDSDKKTGLKIVKYQSPSNYKKGNSYRGGILYSKDNIGFSKNYIESKGIQPYNVTSSNKLKELQAAQDSGMSKKEIQEATKKLKDSRNLPSIVKKSTSTNSKNVTNNDSIKNLPSRLRRIVSGSNTANNSTKTATKNVVKNIIREAEENVTKKGLSRNKKLALGAAAVAGLTGLGYGGKKLYDHYKNKED